MGVVSQADMIETCARIAYEVNRAYCQSIGDDSPPSWAAGSREQEPFRELAKLIIFGAERISAEMFNENWREEKRAIGWVLREKKDPEKMVPYRDLPRDQRVKDALFFAAVRATADALVILP